MLIPMFALDITDDIMTNVRDRKRNAETNYA